MNGQHTTPSIHHIGYAVRDIDLAAESMFNLDFGYEALSEVLENKNRGIKIKFVRSHEGIVFELVQPLDDESAVSAILKRNKNFSCPYHVCYEVEDISESIERMKSLGFYQTSGIEPAPSIGNDADAVFFVSPNVGLIELIGHKFKM